MNFYYTTLPFILVQFWYIEAPLTMLSYFQSLNSAFLQLFSLKLMVVTFFKPLKNEYRKGLVGFSIGMGIFAKTILILFTLTIFLVMLISEFLVISLFVLMPALAIFLLFK